jgi:hypothetical protein
MALPKIEQPTFSVDLISKKKPVMFRPFLVKEHKILLMALESGEMKDILNAIKQIIRNCSIDDLDVDTLPTIDLELMFINLRARSIGEIVDLRYKCNHSVEEGADQCGNPFTIKVDLLKDISVINHNITNKIELATNIGLVMKLPTTKVIEEFALREENPQQEAMDDINLAVECIEYIYDKDGVYYAKDASKEELVEFVSNLTKDQFANVEQFFKIIPSIYVEKEHVCAKCGFEHKVRLEGIADFFM